MDSNFWYRGTKTVDFRSIPGIAGIGGALKRYHLMVQPFFFWLRTTTSSRAGARFE